MASIKIILKNRNGTERLYLQIIKSRTDKTEVSLGKKIPSKFWDSTKQKVKRGYPEFSSTNVYISNEKNAYERLLNEKLALGNPFTVKDIVALRKDAKDPKEQKELLIPYMTSYLNQGNHNLGYNSVRSYKVTLGKVKAFSPKIKFHDFDKNWVARFHKWLVKNGASINTIADKMKIMKRIYHILRNEDKMKLDPFQGYKIKKELGKKIYLERNELKLFENLKIKQKSYDLVRDVFLFECYTGLRISDIITLVSDDVKNTGSHFKLSIRIEKTKERLTFKLHQKAVAIIEKYNYPNNDVIFPLLKSVPSSYTEANLKKEISNKTAYINKILKLLATQLSINKKVTSHVGRHTFATISLDLGTSVEVVQKLLGHSSIMQTMIYAKIMDKQKDAAIDAWDNL